MNIKGEIIYSYISGSKLYGIDTPNSDTDIRGIYMPTKEDFLSLEGYPEQYSDEKGDKVYYSITKFFKLLSKGNLNSIESLYVDNNILVNHPIIDKLKKHRDKFISKELIRSIIGYSVSQIKKCRGLNKKVSQPEMDKKDPIDFCCFLDQNKSIPLQSYLLKNNLKQENIGLCAIPYIKGLYACYYKHNYTSFNDFFENNIFQSKIDAYSKYLEEKEKFYRGVFLKDSSEVRLSSIPKGEIPIGYIYYNKDNYSAYCKAYKDYQEWVKNRNPQRYKDNCELDYDRKNVAHAFRILRMGVEVLEGKGLNLDRTNIDSDFIKRIRNGEFEYDYIIALLDKVLVYISSLYDKSTLPEEIDPTLINNLYKEFINEYYDFD